MGNLDSYRKLRYKIPRQTTAWRIYGQGMQNFGDTAVSKDAWHRDTKYPNARHPADIPVLEPKDDEILVRSDAVGLCFSDTKIIKFGENHPRLQGRNLKSEPVIPGHEVALTVVKAGKKWEGTYRPGGKYIIQADVFYKGKAEGYGYLLPGGLAGYGILGKEVLEGDAGSYLIPVKNKDISYSAAALVEPWACVVAAYRIMRRDSIKKGGNLIFLGNGSENRWTFEALFSGGVPKSVGLLGIGNRTKKAITAALSGKPVEIYEEASGDIGAASQKRTDGNGFDDIILLGETDERVLAQAADSMCRYGIMNYMASTDAPQWTDVDAGKIHYDRISFVGDLGSDVSRPYTENLDSSMKGESVLLFGAGGPMGQMHVHLAVEKDPPPAVIVATDIADKRIEVLSDLFERRAEQRGITFRTFNPSAYSDKDQYRKAIVDTNAGRLFDYVVCLAAIPAVIEEASSYLCQSSILNIFAGVSKGTVTKLNLKEVASKSVRWIGSSGSGVEDMEYTLHQVEQGKLDTNISVAAVSGMSDVWNGIDAVRTGSFPGKIVVYPHIEDLALTSLGELRVRYPEIGELLDEKGGWTKEAEEKLLEKFLSVQ
jgi:threonine dehydrogenase-like Zn-dependent dehydrogenase